MRAKKFMEGFNEFSGRDPLYRVFPLGTGQKRQCLIFLTHESSLSLYLGAVMLLWAAGKRCA
jgi:hypothetical protein